MKIGRPFTGYFRTYRRVDSPDPSRAARSPLKFDFRRSSERQTRLQARGRLLHDGRLWVQSDQQGCDTEQDQRRHE